MNRSGKEERPRSRESADVDGDSGRRRQTRSRPAGYEKAESEKSEVTWETGVTRWRHRSPGDGDGENGPDRQSETPASGTECDDEPEPSAGSSRTESGRSIADQIDRGESARRGHAEICPDCGDRVVSEGREDVCPSCGLVVSVYRIDHGPETYISPHESSVVSRRCYNTSQASDNPGGCRTQIGSAQERDRESGGVVYSRLNRFNCQETDDGKAMLRKSLPEIQRMCSALDLREAIVERSCMIYREAHRVGFLDKRCLELVAGASIYMACREQQLPRFPSEIVDVMRLTEDSTQGNRSPRSSLLRVYRKMWAADEMDINPKPLTPEECLPRFSAELDLGPRTRQIARNLLERVKETRVDGGRRPRTVAAGVIAAAVNEASIPEAAPQQSQVPAEHLADTKIMQSEIADVSEHSATTVREARREFVEELCMETVVQPVSSKDPKGREQAAVA